MQALEQLTKTRDTIEDLQGIVRTMKTLAAVSIHQYNTAIASLLDYNRTVEMGLYIVLQGKAPSLKRPVSHGARKLAAVVFGSDRGLCGRFNEEIADFAIAKMNGFHVKQDDRIVLAVGARVAARLEERRQAVEECFFVPGSVSAVTMTVQQILLKIDEWRTQREVTDVLLFYNHHDNNATHQARMLHLLPVELSRFQRVAEQRWPTHVLPTYNMNREKLFASLIRQYFFVSTFRACAESLASEHASRLASMQAAEGNIEDRLHALTTRLRELRQDSITEELLDVVAGFETLMSGKYEIG